MADVQVATCDGANFDPNLGYSSEPIAGPCPSDPLPLSPEGPVAQLQDAEGAGWVRRKFTGPKYEDNVRWWSFCPDHVKIAVEQYYLARFSDDSE